MAAREYYAASSAAEVSTTSDSIWKAVGTLTFTPVAGRDYVVFWSFEGLNSTSTTTDMRFRIAQDGVAAAFGSVESRATNEYPSHSGFFRLVGAGEATTIAIQIQNENNSATVLGRNANLVALALTESDRYVEALGRVGAPSASFVSLASVSWAPAAGDYLLLASTFVDTFAATAPAYARLQFDGVNMAEQSQGPADVTAGNPDVAPLGAMWMRSVSTGGVTRTASFQGRSHASVGETGYRDSRLLVLKLDGFEAAYTAELASLNGGADSSFVDALTLSASASGNPHLLLANWSSSSTVSSTTASVRVTDGGAQVGLGVRRAISGSADRGVFGGLFAVRPAVAAGARSWALGRRSHDGASVINVMPGAGLAVLDLGAASPSLAAGGVALGVAAPAVKLVVARSLRNDVKAMGLEASLLAPRRTVRVACAPAVLALATPPMAMSRSTGVLRKVSADVASLGLGPLSVKLKVTRRLAANVQARSLSGVASAIRKGRVFASTPNAYAFTGRDLATRRTCVLRFQAAVALNVAPITAIYSAADIWARDTPAPRAWNVAEARFAQWIRPAVAHDTWN